MAQKMITGYTPPEAMGHIAADDDAQIYRGAFTRSGILEADNMLAATIIDNNTVQLASGAYSNQGFVLSIPGGLTETLTVLNGTPGMMRSDLIISEFQRGGGDVPDSHVLRVLLGSESVSSPIDPSLQQDDLSAGGTLRQEAVFRISLLGQQIVGVTRIADVVAAHGQSPYITLPQNSGNFSLSTNTIYAMSLNGAANVTFPAPMPGLQDQILIYMNTTTTNPITWPVGTLFVLGMTPLFRAGWFYRLICEYDPNAGAWVVGVIESGGGV